MANVARNQELHFSSNALVPKYPNNHQGRFMPWENFGGMARCAKRGVKSRGFVGSGKRAPDAGPTTFKSPTRPRGGASRFF